MENYLFFIISIFFLVFFALLTSIMAIIFVQDVGQTSTYKDVLNASAGVTAFFAIVCLILASLEVHANRGGGRGGGRKKK